MFRDHIVKSGQTQVHWARALGISNGYLSGLVSGTKQPSLGLALRIEMLTDGAVPVSSWAREPREDAA